MKRARLWQLSWSTIFAVLHSLVLAHAELPPALSVADAEGLFRAKIYPLLQEKCLACHGNDLKKIKGDFDLRTREGLLKGGESGKPAIVSGNPEKSPLYLAVTRVDKDLEMPPKENDKLSSEQVTWIRQWITAGAPWPDMSKVNPASAGSSKWDNAGGVTMKTSGGRSPEWTNRKYKVEDLWAYQPIQHPAVPRLKIDPGKVKNPIDAFILQKLQDKGLTSASSADKLTLIRRATFDLTGLPPTPAEIEAFQKDKSPAAFEHLVQRLLASPQYGEQQARHWLDVVRYADTSGFSNDFERPNVWRYRDYVIRSFNQDKPYDQFVMEQLAGDEMDANNPEYLIAVGFLRMGPWEHTAMTVAAVTRQQYLDDITQNVGVSLLGQGLRCARCHDHKFDPVPTRDYYRIQSVFSPTQFLERKVPFQTYENIQPDSEAKAAIQRRLDEDKRILAQLNQKNQEAIAAYLKEKGFEKFEDLPREGRVNKGEFGLTRYELSVRKMSQKRKDYFERELERFEPYAFSVYSGPPNNYTSVKPIYGMPAKREGTVPVLHILPGGALETPADEVKPGVLSAMIGWNDIDAASRPYVIPETTESRRLSFAKWVASSNNTLTARVIVNRVWQQHFGRGLVATPNNFGKMGGRPTHPELLDWLATQFIEQGWSLKKLHLLIMTSATYQEAGEHPQMEKIQPVDVKDELLAYYPSHRLAAEEIRDAMLAVTGELNSQTGGPGVFPEINWEVAFQPRHIMGSVAPAYQPSPTPAERNRRTIYAFRYRTLADPILEVFNRPGSEISCERRDETTVTPQVFALFNSEFVNHRALAFAAALEKQTPALEKQIQLAFRLTSGRTPTKDELKACVAHVAKMTTYHRGHPPIPTPLPTSVKRHMVEEMTGEDVQWEEQLDGLKHYQRDLMPWDVEAKTRGLAELCLVLLNSNEFLYVR